jgi:WD40 repeat protein
MQEIKSAPALACVRFAPTAKQIAAVGFDPRVFLIGGTQHSMPRLECDCADLRCCVYQDDEATLAVAGRDGHVHLFDPRTGKTTSKQMLHDGRIRDMVFMPDSSILVSVAEDGEVVRFDAATDQILSRHKITSGRLFTLAIIDSQTIAAAGSDDEIYVVAVSRDPEPLQVIGTLQGHVGSVATLVVSNGVLVSGGFDATIRKWKLPDFQDRIAKKPSVETR